MTNEKYFDIIQNADVAPLTKITYIMNLKKIIKCCDNDLCHIINNPDTSFKTLYNCFTKNNITEASLFSTVGSLMSLLKWSKIKEIKPDVYKKWSDGIFKPLSVKINNSRESNEPTEKQQNAMISWIDILKKYNSIKKKNPYDHQHLFLAMSVLLPVRRQADYSKVWLSKRDNESLELKCKDNTGWIDLWQDKPTINIIVYKTSKDYKQWTKELPDKLSHIINKSLQKHPRNYLLVDVNNNPWNSVNSFTQYHNRLLKKIFDNKFITLNTLRHSYATWIHEQNFTVGERKDIAKNMGHSLTTNMLYVLKDKTSK